MDSTKKKTPKKEIDAESKTIIQPHELKSGEKKAIKENKEPLTLKTPKLEICISPLKDGRKFEIEVFTDLEGEKRNTPKRSSPAINRQALKDLNQNGISPPGKRRTKRNVKVQENMVRDEILTGDKNLNLANNDAAADGKKEMALPCRRRSKKIKSRVSLSPQTKSKSLKPTPNNKIKTRHTLPNLTAFESTNEKEKDKFSDVSNSEFTKKITRKRGVKLAAGDQSNETGNVENIEKLKRVFPNVDPVFLRSRLSETKNDLDDLIKSLKEKEKSGELPLDENYKKKLESEKIASKFMQDFTVQNFLKAIPDPWNYFLNTEIHNSVKYVNHSLYYLKNKHKKHYSQTIQEILTRCNYSLYTADKELSNKRKNRMLKMRATNRSKSECDSGKPDNVNFQFLQEVVFIENENEIIEEIKKIESAKSKRLKKAKRAGSLLRCQSCFRSDLLWDEAACCSGIHVFCGKCINRYVEIEMGRGNFNFNCILKCEEILPLDSIQDVVNPDLMAVIVRRNQLNEMRSAGIENLEFCPYCYHIIDIISEQSTLSCPNPCCKKELCRYCKKTSHIPLECSEVDNFNMTKSMLEEKIGNKFIICNNCKREFIKEDDSNKMVCSCGIVICSVCHLPFSDCPHFISKCDDDNSTTNDELSYKSSQEEPDTPKKENFEIPQHSSLPRGSFEFLPDFVSSDSGTF